jgi:hypothetical protein
MSTPTPSRGIGRGGRREGAGRPLGSIDRKARSLIIEAEREGLQMPLDFLLDLMRDPEMPLRDRAFCAVAAAPYVHARRAVVRVIPSPQEMDDAQLVEQVAKYEELVAAMPEKERAESLDAQFRHMLEDVPRLHPTRQEAFYRGLVKAGEDGLQRLAEHVPPGAVIPRSSDRHNLTRPS